MRKLFSIISLATLLLLAACGDAKFSVDNTTPVSDDNRVIYQLNIGAFTKEGTFKAAQQRLDTLHTLGADIIWLMPIYPRGATKHSPYASMNFREVNPAYGKVSDVKAFVKRAHELGMKVWLDWVPNHVAVENPWVQTHPEYFTRDAAGKMIHPHGWMDVYELNYKDEGLVNAMNECLRFWIKECDVDGFRCDYVSSPTIPVAYWQKIIAELKSRGKVMEFLCETDISNTDNVRIDSCGFDYDYAWDLQEALVRKFGAKGNKADSLKALCQMFRKRSGCIKNRRMVYLTNHDQNYNDGGHTLKDFYGDNRYALTVIQFTLYGMPLIYQGQEIGDLDTLNYFTDAKVNWSKVDRKMLNTVRTLIALRHMLPAFADEVEPEWLTTGNVGVLAYKKVNGSSEAIVVLNVGEQPADIELKGININDFKQMLDSRSISDKPSVDKSVSERVTLDAKGYAIFVREQ